jgi:hypothetical protein
MTQSALTHQYNIHTKTKTMKGNETQQKYNIIHLNDNSSERDTIIPIIIM